MRWLAMATVLLANVAAADPPDVPDPSMIPDASVGQGGAQQGSEENNDDSTTACTTDADCDKGLKCTNHACTWQQYRQATFIGCGGKAVAVATIGLVLTIRPRRRKSVTGARGTRRRR